MTTYIDNEEKLKNIIEQAKEIIQDIKGLKIERITEEMEKLEKRLEFQVVEKYDNEEVGTYNTAVSALNAVINVVGDTAVAPSVFSSRSEQKRTQLQLL